jgi:hypothetical protein
VLPLDHEEIGKWQKTLGFGDFQRILSRAGRGRSSPADSGIYQASLALYSAGLCVATVLPNPL